MPGITDSYVTSVYISLYNQQCLFYLKQREVYEKKLYLPFNEAASFKQNLE